ncbi:MAG: hypothetical protein MZW92_63710 [Comamonadaceae bacterium]|nr:hypothetical protein [Comamonadaceae bacterium]
MQSPVPSGSGGPLLPALRRAPARAVRLGGHRLRLRPAARMQIVEFLVEFADEPARLFDRHFAFK